jgi:hypothetical protein
MSGGIELQFALSQAQGDVRWERWREMGSPLAALVFGLALPWEVDHERRVRWWAAREAQRRSQACSG